MIILSILLFSFTILQKNQADCFFRAKGAWKREDGEIVGQRYAAR
jgi:hypothetical protein